jgi:hypothetical protein
MSFFARQLLKVLLARHVVLACHVVTQNGDVVQETACRHIKQHNADNQRHCWQLLCAARQPAYLRLLAMAPLTPHKDGGPARLIFNLGTTGLQQKVLLRLLQELEQVNSPSASAADSALSSSKDLDGRAAEPAARAPSNETAVEIWLRAARCRGASGVDGISTVSKDTADSKSMSREVLHSMLQSLAVQAPRMKTDAYQGRKPAALTCSRARRVQCRPECHCAAAAWYCASKSLCALVPASWHVVSNLPG